MKLAYTEGFGGYYNLRIDGIANALKYLDPSNMVNADDSMAYGFNMRGELVINIRRHADVDIVFRDTRMELYHANSYGIIIKPDERIYIDYAIFDGMNNDDARKFVNMKIKALSSSDPDDSDFFVTEQHEASPVFNKTWHSHMNHNIEGIRDAYDFIGIDNMRCGQAFFAINNMSRLCILLHHHASFKRFTDIDEKDWGNAIVVEFDGDGVITIFDADEYGMPKEEQTVGHFERFMDSHGTNKKSHQIFVENAKKNHGVYLV